MSWTKPTIRGLDSKLVINLSDGSIICGQGNVRLWRTCTTFKDVSIIWSVRGCLQGNTRGADARADSYSKGAVGGTMGEPEETLIKLVIIDDDPATLGLVKAVLEQDALEILTATDPQNGLDLIYRERPEIVLTDLMMPKLGGMEVLEKTLAFNPTIEVILMTGQYSTESAVEAIQKGAADYLNKPVSVDKLRQRVAGLIQVARQARREMQLDHDVMDAYKFEGMIGRSALMLDVYTRIRRIAPHYRTALVSGPTGTGKELVARSLHGLSPAGAGTFAVCNCSAIIETLFESELFGYVKGAFTGATQDKIGLFEYANGGTLMLDEIGEMPLPTQAKLLRVLQTQEIQRVGSPA